MAMEFNKPPRPFSQTPQDTPESRYSRAKQVWAGLIGTSTVQAQNWRLIAFGLFLLCLLEFGGMMYLITKSTVEAYFVPVDAVGAVGQPQQVQAYNPQQKEIEHFLGEFIQKTRTIPKDAVLYRKNWDTAYKFLTQEASTKMNKLVEAEKQVEKMQKRETTQAQVIAIGKVSEKDNLYQVRWKEDTFEVDGKLKDSCTMVAFFTITFAKPKNAEDLWSNPLGLFIQDFSWSREQ